MNTNRWSVSGIFKSIFLMGILLFTSYDANGQFFRVRERTRFNVSADGFWMKGKLAFPGQRFGLADDGAVFSDVKVVVKNRRGERRPRKRRADVNIDVVFFGIVGGEIIEVGGANRNCSRSKRCKYRVQKIFLEEEFLDMNIDIVGMAACISGQRADRDLTRFSRTVGRVPREFDRSEFCRPFP